MSRKGADGGDVASAYPRYEIRILGHLASHRLRWFEGLIVDHRPNGETVLVWAAQDQQVLYGLLSWLQSIGACLISVRHL
jgi:hypothetical protein